MAIIYLLMFLTLSLYGTQGCDDHCFKATKVNTKLPSPRTSVRAAYDGNDTIYLVGGYGGLDVSIYDILKFTISTEELSLVGEIRIRLDGPSVAIDEQNRLYIMRGHDGTRRIHDIYRFTPNSGQFEATHVGAFDEADSHDTVFQPDGTVAYIMGGYLRNHVIKYDFLRNTTETLLEHPQCASMLPVWDQETRSATVFCGRGALNNTAFVWTYGLDANEVSGLREGFPGFYDQPGAALVDEDAYVYGIFGDGWDGGLLKYNLPSGNMTFVPVTDFPGSPESPLRGAAVVHVPRLNRLYLFGGSRVGQTPFFQDTICHISLGCDNTPPPTTTERPSTPDLWSCFNKADGFYPHPLGCERFVGCRALHGSEYTCPTPYLFDPALSTCNQPHLVNCPLTCEGKEDGLHPHPYDCGLGISCAGRELDVFKCPPPLLFDPVARICNFPDLVDCAA